VSLPYRLPREDAEERLCKEDYGEISTTLKITFDLKTKQQNKNFDI